MKVKYFIPMAVLAMSLSSCLDNDNDNEPSSTQSWTYGDCFNVVTTTNEQGYKITKEPRYNFALSIKGAEAKMKISMSNIRLGDDIALSSFDLPALTATQEAVDKPITIVARDIVPENQAASGVIFDNIEVQILNRVIQNGMSGQWTASYVYKIRFSVNGKYNVTVFPLTTLLYGTTTSTPVDGGQPYMSTDTRYAIVMDLTDTANPVANLDITGAKFLAAMPALDMTFPKIPVSFVGNALQLTAANLIPQIKTGSTVTPYPNFPISDLNLGVTPVSGGSLNFNCVANTHGTFTVNSVLAPLSPSTPKTDN